MPLEKSSSKGAFVRNLKAEIHAGKPQSQALAIAYDVKRRNRADGGELSDQDNPSPDTSDRGLFDPKSVKESLQRATAGNPQKVFGAVTQYPGHVLEGLATLPKRAIEAAGQDVQHLGDHSYEPQLTGPALEAAMLPMGAGAIAGLSMRAGETALGSGLIRSTPEAKAAQGINWDRSTVAQGLPAYQEGAHVIDVPVAALDRAFKKTDPRFYVDKPKQEVSDYAASGRPMSLAEVDVSNGRIGFTNGRNRFAAARDMGEETIPVSTTTPEALVALLRKHGSGEKVLGAEAVQRQTPGDISPIAKHYQKYYGQRTWSTEAEARADIERKIAKINETGFGSPVDPSFIDELNFVTSGKGVKISQAGTQSRKPVEILDEPTGSAPAVDWNATDLMNKGTPQSAMANYGRGNGTVRQGYISLDDLPKEKLAGGHSAYVWDELQRSGPKSPPPPATVRINKNGIPSIMDGNHRIAYWREQGHDQIPAFIIDERNVKGNRAKGGSVNKALNIAYADRRQARADGGGVFEGPIVSEVPGRTDKHPIDVAAGSYVLPSSHVASLGEDNTLAGMKHIKQLGPHGIRKMAMAAKGAHEIARKHRLKRALGGSAGDEATGHAVPIIAAGGEHVMTPEEVRIVGGGDVTLGHRLLDNWVVENRKNHVKTLSALDPPAKD